jgi:DNA mismatch repair protein MSH6
LDYFPRFSIIWTPHFPLFFHQFFASGLSYMKGHMAHAGFPEISYGPMADKLVRAGYKVARVEQTETPQMLQERKKSCKGRGKTAPKVVNREVCSIMTLGTRTFCYLDDRTGILAEAANDAMSVIGPLLVIGEVLLDTTATSSDDKMDVEEDDDDKQVQPVAEYGITVVDAVRGDISIGQFADDCLRTRMGTLLTTFNPSEVC